MTQEELKYKLVTQLVLRAGESADRQILEAEFFLDEFPFWVPILTPAADVSEAVKYQEWP